MFSSKCLRILLKLSLPLSTSKRAHVDDPFVTPDSCRNSIDIDSDSAHGSLFDLWKASRQRLESSESTQEGWQGHSHAGMRRKCNIESVWLAFAILRTTFTDMALLIWGIDPLRITTLVLLTIIRGLLPAFKGYSQALIIDEAQQLFSKGDFTSASIARLGHLILRECGRMVAESLFDTVASHNEAIVHGSLRFVVEQRQLEQRLRLDKPTLADPIIRDLLHESDLFVRSFTGLGFGFGLFSPLDLLRMISSVAELATQVIILYSASRASNRIRLPGFADVSGRPTLSHLPLYGAIVLPFIVSLLSFFIPGLHGIPSGQYAPSETLYSPAEAREAERAERMRSMANGEQYRAEIQIFGLSRWILNSWTASRRKTLGLETSNSGADLRIGVLSGIKWIVSQTNASEVLVLLQNLPLFVYSSSTSLGSLALYRDSLHSLSYTLRSLMTSIERAYQSIFLMGAFFAAMSIEPHLSPPHERLVKYKSHKCGMKVEARNISYTYPGSESPTLRDVSFTLEAGETLAIVGYNGAGKSTLADVLLRVIDFESSSSERPAQLLVNGTDIRRIAPQDYHRHVTALFQSFSKLNATVRENVGIGNLQSNFRDRAIQQAAERAGAGRLVNSLPCGIDTNLDCMGSGLGGFCDSSFFSGDSFSGRQGLSGGEWQRVAISRAFMRAKEADLLLLDEPTSHLDAHAQNNVLKAVDQICRDPTTGKRSKTVIIITHQLSIARRADKIAMFENGTITEFGSHDELMERSHSHYASLYRATMC